MNITRSQDNIRVDLSSRDAEALLSGVGTLDEDQSAALDSAAAAAVDAVAQLVSGLIEVLSRGKTTVTFPPPSR